MKRDYYSDSLFSSFFNPHELTKIVLKSSTKYYCTKLHHLAWRTEPKRFFLFSRVTYQTGRDQRVPPFNFFRHCETFFRKFFPQRVPPSTATKMLTISEVSPLLARQGLALACAGAPLGPLFWFFDFRVLYINTSKSFSYF